MCSGSSITARSIASYEFENLVVFLAMLQLGFAALLASKPSRAHVLVKALVASRTICPSIKLATTRLWRTISLAADFGVSPSHHANGAQLGDVNWLQPQFSQHIVSVLPQPGRRAVQHRRRGG